MRMLCTNKGNQRMLAEKSKEPPTKSSSTSFSKGMSHMTERKCKRGLDNAGYGFLTPRMRLKEEVNNWFIGGKPHLYHWFNAKRDFLLIGPLHRRKPFPCNKRRTCIRLFMIGSAVSHLRHNLRLKAQHQTDKFIPPAPTSFSE